MVYPYVSENYRKQNIGSKLLTRFIKEIEMEKVRNLELEVRTDNKKAIEFYKKHGFNIKHKIDEFYQNGESAYTMKKEI